MVRINLVTNPSFETDKNGWDANGSRSQAVPSGVYAGAWYVSSGSVITSAKFPATAGLDYTGSGWFNKSTSSARSGAISVRFYDAASAELSAPTVTLTPLATIDVKERRSDTRTAPAGTTQVAVAIHLSSTLGTIQADAILLEQSATLGDYFDGSTVNTGFAYAWTGTPHASTSTEVVDTGSPYVKAVYRAENLSAANPTITVVDTPVTGDVLVLLAATNGVDAGPTAVSGCGATWTHVLASNSQVLDTWIGTGATTSGTITATAGAVSRSLAVYVLSNVSSSVSSVTAFATSAVTSPAQDGGAGQIVIGFTFSDTSANAITTLVPSTGWTEPTPLALATSTRYSGLAHRVPGTTDSHTTSAARSGGNTFVIQLVVGTLDSGGGDRTAALGVGVQTGPVALGVTAHLGIDVGVAAVASGPIRTATLGVDVSAGPTSLGVSAPLGIDIETGPVALGVTAPLGVNVETEAIASGPSRTATLDVAVATAAVANSRTAQTSINIDVDANWTPPVVQTRTAALGIAIITPAEAFFDYPPAALGTTPLGKLVSFSVSTSAVPINPAEGSGATPSVSAGYIKGVDTEFALGETNVLSWGTVGTYEGEIVSLGLPEGSDVARVSQDTAMTLLNNELHLFPFIDAAPSVWTAARAIDYWTQQCGLFYDKVPGDCIAYASGFGHTDSYGAANTARFYEKLTGGTTSTTVLNNRSVKTLGSAVTGTTAFHELPKGNVPVSVPTNSKLVASVGLGIRGTGRTATVAWKMIDSKKVIHTLSISATSAGAVTASIGGVPVAATTVTPDADYRLTFSVEPLSSTAVVGKLTVHTDDLAGTGSLVYESASTGASYALPAVAYLTSITHVSAGGSGSQMLRWGTYLTVAQTHPMTLPAVQKVLSETGKEFGFVSGFEGNVWALLNEYCAITRQDISFLDAKMNLTPRIAGLSVPLGNFHRFSRDSERREKYKQVAVMNKQSRAVSTDDAVLWRADSVFQVAAREVFETTVQTGHSILSLVQPVAVEGILPFPYTVGGGQYVVTGADGYIVAPAWWNDNGGKVEVSLTGKEGEIAIKITAPALDSVRAPYRISEGEADRPALYVSGSGILNDPKEVHVGTGAKNAKEGFDSVFESPFIAGVMETYDTAAAMAAEYSASVADVGFEIPNDFYTPSRFGQYPAGTRFTDGKRNYRITDASQTHSRVSGSAVPHTTIGDYVGSYPAGATLADEKARHTGRTIKQFNISPLRGTDA